MTNALGVVGVVFAVSVLEGLWTWLLAAAMAEVAGQGYPSASAVSVVLFAAWFASRALTLGRVSLERRRWALVGGGVAAAFAAGVVQSGLVHPLQLVFGSYSPDYRGSGIALLLAVAYLWGRGLALAVRVNRERVLNHIVASAAGLATVLIFLPLTRTVQTEGLGVVVAGFLAAVTALLLSQLVGAESRQLSPLQWASVGGASAGLALLGGAVLTGAFASGVLGLVGGALTGIGRLARPLTDAVLLAAGYLAQYLALFIRMMMDVFGPDDETIQRGVQRAEESRPQFELDPNAAPPEFMSVLVAVFLTLLFVAAVVAIFHRLVARAGRETDDVLELRSPLEGPGPAGALKGALSRLGFGGPREADDPRSAIRRHYRAFQVLMARAGLPRRPSQTAAEFGGVVSAEVPPAEPHVDELTGAYQLARYGPPGAALPDPGSVGEAVVRVRDALREQDSS